MRARAIFSTGFGFVDVVAPLFFVLLASFVCLRLRYCLDHPLLRARLTWLSGVAWWNFFFAELSPSEPARVLFRMARTLFSSGIK